MTREIEIYSGMRSGKRYWSVTKQDGGWYRAGPFALIIQETHSPTITTYKPVIKRDHKMIWAGKTSAIRLAALGEGKQRLNEMARHEVRCRQSKGNEFDAQSERLAASAAVRSLVNAMSPVAAPTPKGFRQ